MSITLNLSLAWRSPLLFMACRVVFVETELKSDKLIFGSKTNAKTSERPTAIVTCRFSRFIYLFSFPPAFRFHSKEIIVEPFIRISRMVCVCAMLCVRAKCSQCAQCAMCTHLKSIHWLIENNSNWIFLFCVRAAINFSWNLWVLVFFVIIIVALRLFVI